MNYVAFAACFTGLVPLALQPPPPKRAAPAEVKEAAE
jgi:hypothetical protein